MKSLRHSRGVVLGGALLLMHTPTALAAGSGENTPLNLGGSTSGTHASSGGGSSLIRTIVGLFIVIVVIYGVAWVLRAAKRGSANRARGKALAPIASLPLGSGRSVQLVRAGNEILLLGVAEHGVTPIRRYTVDEAIEAGLDLPEDEDECEPRVQEESSLGRVVESLRRMTVRS
ncbi:MAG TPA: flagellar biosynthetic protein FliO [Solirubrobacteraceae bacterium]|nr:flagellar biosynthetic protein FliO [Solirubrobacteraceae bacterium]